MHHRYLRLNFFLSALVALPSWAAPTLEAKAMKEVRASWDQCNKLRHRSDVKKQLYVDGSAEGAKKIKWETPRSPRNYEEASDKADLYFDSNKNLFFAEISGGSESGDHSFVTDYCFRKDGSLAFLLRTLKTFQSMDGGVREEKRIWIDSKRAEYVEEVKVFNLETGKIIPAEKANYQKPENMEWKTLPDHPEKLTAKSFLRDF